MTEKGGGPPGPSGMPSTPSTWSDAALTCWLTAAGSSPSTLLKCCRLATALRAEAATAARTS